MSFTKTLMTVEEFAHMRASDTEDYELGERNSQHSIIRAKLGDLLRAYFGANKPG